MAKRKAKKRAKPKSRPPRPDKMPGPLKYKMPTGDAEPSMLEIASMRKKKKIIKLPGFCSAFVGCGLILSYIFGLKD